MFKENTVSKPKTTSSFGFQGRPARRKVRASSSGPTNEELVRDYLARGNKITPCDPRYAEGALQASGEYEF